MRQPLPARFGRYVLLRVLGEGSSAQVFGAQCPIHGSVAVKILRPELAGDTEVATRFLRETTLSMAIEHEALVPAYDAGTEQGCHFLSNAWMRGGTLLQRLRLAPLRPAAALAVADRVLAALSAIHAAGAVHRDVKPSNVLFDGRGRAYLGDLGLARFVKERQLAVTMPGFAIGSPAWMAPEQRRGAGPEPRSDLYAAGALLYMCLTGTLPVRGGDTRELLHNLRAGTGPDPEAIAALPSAVRAPLQALLAPLPEQRPRDAGAARELLRAARELLPPGPPAEP